MLNVCISREIPAQPWNDSIQADLNKMYIMCNDRNSIFNIKMKCFSPQRKYCYYISLINSLYQAVNFQERQ